MWVPRFAIPPSSWVAGSIRPTRLPKTSPSQAVLQSYLWTHTWRGVLAFEPDDGSTRFTQNFEAEVGGFFRLAESLVKAGDPQTDGSRYGDAEGHIGGGEHEWHVGERRRPPTRCARTV